MQLQITARHLELTPALREYVRKKIERAQRYFDAIIWAQAILQIQKHRHLSELIVHTPGSTFRVLGEAGDLYSAIDIAAHKLALHMSKLKDKHRHHRKKKVTSPNKVLSPPLLMSSRRGALSEVETRDEISSLITEVSEMELQPKSIVQALRELNSNGLQFSIFLNERTNQLNLVYRKGKGFYGLLQVSALTF